MDKNLCSIEKMQKDIALLASSPLISAGKKGQIDSLNCSFTNVVSPLDLFIKNFSDYGWCAYESMSSELAKKANKAFEEGGIDKGEKELIDYYKTKVKNTIYGIKSKSEPFMIRCDLIHKALDYHFNEEYYASVPLLLMVIDGVVHDFTKQKGFFSNGTDISAWDCIVGCDNTLVKARNLCAIDRPKTITDEIQLPYRNGILHGRDLNYANEYVSCKCISLLLAVSDWIQLKSSEDYRKEKFAKELNQTTQTESLTKFQQAICDKEKIAKWKPRCIQIGVDISPNPTVYECQEFPYIIPLIEIFESWKSNNYGKLSTLLKKKFINEKNDNRRAGECKKTFRGKELISYTLKKIEEIDCSLSKISFEASWESNGKTHTGLLEFTCQYLKDNGTMGFYWNGNGNWIITPLNLQPHMYYSQK